MIGWDVPNELHKYFNKLSYVAMSSRLDRDSEVFVDELFLCVDDLLLC
jgi:hypothetical protein